MRILANEDVPGETVAALRQRAHDVVWARIDAPGSSDHQVLERAAAEERILITLDKDFGELAFRSRLPAASGIILLRIRGPEPSALTRIALAALEARDDWAGHFSVVEHNRIRMTPLPSSA